MIQAAPVVSTELLCWWWKPSNQSSRHEWIPGFIQQSHPHNSAILLLWPWTVNCSHLINFIPETPENRACQWNSADKETKGTFHVQISAPPGRSYELLNRPVPPERGWTSSPGQTGRCARRDTPSSIGQREQLSKEHHAQQIEEQEVPTCTEWILHPVTIKGNGTRLSLHMVNNQAK